jgi:hypothetical protein
LAASSGTRAPPTCPVAPITSTLAFVFIGPSEIKK